MTDYCLSSVLHNLRVRWGRVWDTWRMASSLLDQWRHFSWWNVWDNTSSLHYVSVFISIYSLSFFPLLLPVSSLTLTFIAFLWFSYLQISLLISLCIFLLPSPLPVYPSLLLSIGIVCYQIWLNSNWSASATFASTFVLFISVKGYS